MKKILYVFFFAMLLFVLVGCNGVNLETSAELMKALQKEDIIDASYSLLETYTQCERGIIPHNTTYQVYQDRNDNLIVILFQNDAKNDDKYIATIYYDVTLENVEYLNDVSSLNSYYHYSSDDRNTKDCKYKISDSKRYYITKSKFFVFTKYSISQE